MNFFACRLNLQLHVIYIRNPDKAKVVALLAVNMGGMLPVSLVDSFQTGPIFDFVTEWKIAAASKFHESN